MTDTPKPALRYAEVLRAAADVHGDKCALSGCRDAAALRRLAELCEECERPKLGDARTVGLACITLCDLIAAGYREGAE